MSHKAGRAKVQQIRQQQREQAKMKVSAIKVSKPQITKTHARREASVKGRYELQYESKARAQARRKSTMLAKAGLPVRGASKEQGRKLLSGIEGMARRVNLDEERYNRIMRMDPKKLDAMYRKNDLVFDVFFSYSGIETDPETGAYVVSEDKTADFDFLIEQYNRLFPESKV